MDRSPQRILYGVTGQKLLHRVHLGRPSAAEVKVFERLEDDDQAPQWTESGTVDTVSTTLSAAAGFSQSDPSTVTLTSAAGVQAGRLYRLKENGRGIWVEPVEIDGNDVRLRHQLKEDWTTSAEFESTYVEVDIDDTWAAGEDHLTDHRDPNPQYRVRWELTVDGDKHIEYTFFDLVRGSVEHHLTLRHLEKFWPGLTHQLTTDERVDEAQSLIDAAWREVQSLLHNTDISEAAIRDNAAADQLTLLAARRMMAEGGMKPHGYDSLIEFIEVAQGAESRYFEQNFKQVQRRDLARGTGGGTGAPSNVPLWVK